jgi:hypothetical protein
MCGPDLRCYLAERLPGVDKDTFGACTLLVKRDDIARYEIAKRLQDRLRERNPTLGFSGRRKNIEGLAVVGGKETRHRQTIRRMSYCVDAL